MWLCYNRIRNALGGVVFSKGIIWWGAPSPGFSRFCRFFHNQTFLDKKMLIKECVFPPSRSREKISSVRKNILSQTTGVNSNEHIRARSPYLPRLRSRGGPTPPRPLQAARPHLQVPGLPAPPPRAPPRLPLTHFFNYYVNTAPILKGTLQLTFQKSYKALPREGREGKETAHVTFES